MLIDGNTEAINKAFGLFGMSTSDSFNLIIAFIAVAGFIFSIFISIRTLNQTKNFALFDKRFALIQYFIKYFNGNWKTAPNDKVREEFMINTVTVPLLFDDCKPLTEALSALMAYYDKSKPLPHYGDHYVDGKRVTTQTEIEDFFVQYVLEVLYYLRKQLGSSKHTKKPYKYVFRTVKEDIYRKY